jgi:uncharacterized protein YbaP (TraB family)
MKRGYLVLLLLCCIFSSSIQAQTTPAWPKTLLWRISGNGLSQNSFLYGTMHLQDKRLFYFPDSLYKYLEQADGYALEIDLQELMDSVMQKIIDQKEDEIVDKRRLDRPADKKKLIDSLLQNVIKHKDKASKKQLEKIRNEKMKKAMKNREMPTIMDAYLYGIARRHGKWLGGIEDVQDQLSVFDEFGTEINEEELMASDNELAVSLEKMINIYLAKDLEQIEKYCTGRYSDELEDAMFLKRNVKMAKRMDSLAHVRSMFFTVGAAHLPGDSGVINLLRRKGYRVDPVFSTTKIDPDQYNSRLAQTAWTTIEDERQTYRVEMPGKASDLNMFGELVRMKFFIDITTFTYFMSGSTIVQKEVNFEKAVKQLSSNTNAKVLSKKLIEKDGMKGIECTMMSQDAYYRAQYLIKENILYILLAGGEKKGVLQTDDLKRFFNSFVATQKKQDERPKQWTVFGLKEKAFTVELPGQPRRNEKMEKRADGSEWLFTVYEYVDQSSGNYYTVQIRDIKPGYYLQGDSAYFTLFRDNLKQVVGKVTKDTVLSIASFPALSYEGEIEDGDLPFKTLTITRGNRVYNLFAVCARTKDSADVERFLNSVTLTDYEKQSWKKETAPAANFYTTVPASIDLMPKEKDDEEEEEEDSEMINYVSYNPNDCISYHVIKRKMSPYYWVKDDSTFFEKWGLGYKLDNDSVLVNKWVTNGKLKGKEWVILTPGNTNLKKIRHLLNGDTLYTLLSFIPHQYINDKEQQKFFEEFRIINEQTSSDIFKSKAAKLLKDLQSADPDVYSKASAEFAQAEFDQSDLPLLQQALLHEYIYDTNADNRSMLQNRVSMYADSSTTSFIHQNFSGLTGTKEPIKMGLLRILVSQETSYSYSIFKELILKHTPLQGENNMTRWWMTDATLNRTLYPEILTLSKNTLFSKWVISMTNQMIDSGLISRDMVMPYEDEFLYTADTLLASLKKEEAEEIYAYSYTELLQLLRVFNTAESNRMLQQYLLIDNSHIKIQSAVSLLKNNSIVDPKQLEKIAADRLYRRDLYDELTILGKIKLFPSKYNSQQSIAESDAYNAAYEDIAPEEFTFIKSVTRMYKGEKKRFYLYKWQYGIDEGDDPKESTYLVVAGPYSLDTKDLNTKNEMSGLHYSENYDKDKLDELLDAYMKEITESEKEED